MKFYESHPHGNMPAIEATDLSATQIADAIAQVRHAVMFGGQYDAVGGLIKMAHPFVQGEDVKHGWLFIEFWCDNIPNCLRAARLIAKAANTELEIV